VFEKTCEATQKNVKSHVFLDFEKNVKNVKNVPEAYSTYSFTGHLIAQILP